MDAPHRFVLGYSYELPFGPGKRYFQGPGFGRHFASGWELNGVYTVQSGTPLPLYNVTNTVGNYTAVTDVYGTFNSNSFPNYNGQPLTVSGSKGQRLNQWFNVGAFSQPPPFTYGTAGRTITAVRTDGTNNLDLGVFKNNRFGRDERLNLQLRGEFFNVANHIRFGPPGLAFGNATFGVVSTQGNTPRQIQLAAKFIF
jgi:hypothetical protein